MNTNVIDMDLLLDELEQTTEGFSFSSSIQPDSIDKCNVKKFELDEKFNGTESSLVEDIIVDLSNSNITSLNFRTSDSAITDINCDLNLTNNDLLKSTQFGKIINDLSSSNADYLTNESLIENLSVDTKTVENYLKIDDINDAFVAKKILLDIDNTQIISTLSDFQSSNVSELVENSSDLKLSDVNNSEILLNIEFLKKLNDLLTEIILPEIHFCFADAKVIAKTKNYETTIANNIEIQQDLLKENSVHKNNKNLLEKSDQLNQTTENINELLENTENNCLMNSNSENITMKNQSDKTVNKINEVIVIEDVPSTSSNEANVNKSVVSSTHDVSAFSGEFKLTESELQLGKVKPYWIPDEDCTICMLCSSKFTIVNRRHHCRSCGRVLCGSCCLIRRLLPYRKLEEDNRKQRICAPCNKTLDRIEIYEKILQEQENDLNVDNLEKNTNNNNTSQNTLKRKKSVLKVRIETTDNNTSNIQSPSTATSVDQINFFEQNSSEVLTNNNILNSVESLSGQKRSVTFRDGVNPGDDGFFITTQQSLNQNEAISLKTSNNEPNKFVFKKPLKKLTRKTMEKRTEEENFNLLERNCLHIFYVKNYAAELASSSLADIWHKILTETDVTIAIRRNLYVTVQITTIFNRESDNTEQVLNFYTQGFNSLGVDEIVIVIEWNSNTEIISNKSCLSNNETNSEENKVKEEKVNNIDKDDFLLNALRTIDNIFTSCITVTENSTNLDDRLGIRRCSRRMSRLYYLQTNNFMGIEASAIFLHRNYGQSMGFLKIPLTSFFIGTFLKGEELIWAQCVPNRVAYAIGKQSSCYPMSIINFSNRKSVFSSNSANMSVLKVLNDFRTFSYQIAYIAGSYVSLLDTKTEVIIPKFAKDQIKNIIETNRNLLGWSLDFNKTADSHLVCLEEQSSASEADTETTFCTQIFSNSSNRKVTGATFIIFDGALKSVVAGNSAFSVNVVEDGVVIRLTIDALESLIKSLLIGEDFLLSCNVMELNVIFKENLSSFDDCQGALVSPIDNKSLLGCFQYGLVFHRAIRSFNYLPSSSEWALRLGSVINMETNNSGKFPSRLQSKYFEICEQLTILISGTIDLLIDTLVNSNQKNIVIRVFIDDESAFYQTSKWDKLDNEHYIWCLTLDNQIIPYLYSLCPWIASLSPLATCFHVELYMQIVSARPLPYCCVSTLKNNNN